MNKQNEMVKSFNKARKEEMTIINSGASPEKAFIVIHGEVAYKVTMNKDNQIKSCDCPHHFYRNVVCKHMIKVALEKGIEIAEIEEKTV